MALAPVYVISSDEPFLKNEKSSMLIQMARKELPEAEFMLFTNNDFSSGATANLAKLENELIDPGLFGGDRIIKIYLDSINSTTVQVLHLLAKRSRPGVVCVVEIPRIKKTTLPTAPEKYTDKFKGQSSVETKLKHVLAFLMDIGGINEILYAPSGVQFSQWIGKQAQKHGLAIEPDVISFLSLCCEGNLVAVDQFFSIAKISGKNSIDLETAKAYLESSSRYSGFEFSEAVLAPNTMRALNILASLCQTNTNRTQMLSMVVSNFDKMLWVMRKLKEPENAQILKSRNFKERSAFFKSHGIVLPSTSDVILRAAQTMPQDFYDYLVTELAQAAKYLQEFDDKKAYQSLQNMAVSVYTAAVRDLKKL